DRVRKYPRGRIAIASSVCPNDGSEQLAAMKNQHRAKPFAVSLYVRAHSRLSLHCGQWARSATIFRISASSDAKEAGRRESDIPGLSARWHDSKHLHLQHQVRKNPYVATPQQVAVEVRKWQ